MGIFPVRLRRSMRSGREDQPWASHRCLCRMRASRLAKPGSAAARVGAAAPRSRRRSWPLMQSLPSEPAPRVAVAARSEVTERSRKSRVIGAMASSLSSSAKCPMSSRCGGREGLVVLAPHDQGRRLMPAAECLALRMQRHVRAVVAERVEPYVFELRPRGAAQPRTAPPHRLHCPCGRVSRGNARPRARPASPHGEARQRPASAGAATLTACCALFGR